MCEHGSLVAQARTHDIIKLHLHPYFPPPALSPGVPVQNLRQVYDSSTDTRSHKHNFDSEIEMPISMSIINQTMDWILNLTSPTRPSSGLEILVEKEIILASLFPQLSFSVSSHHLVFQTPIMFEAKGRRGRI